jgi:hypothetical protein
LVQQFELYQPDFLVFIVISVALIFSAIAIAPRVRGLNEMRSVAALDAIDEVIKSCAERGRPLLYSGTYLNPRWHRGSSIIPSANAISKYVATQCANLDIELYSTAGNPEYFLMMEDHLRQGYLISDHPERHNPRNEFFVASYFGVPYFNSELLVSKSMGSYIQMGWSPGSSVTMIYEAARRAGTLTLTANLAIDTQPLGVIFADYPVIGEEQVAISAYLTKDPFQISTLIGSDFVKLFWVAIGIGTLILSIGGL